MGKDGTVVRKTANFIAVNGWYIFSIELLSRLRTRIRSAFLASSFGAEGLSIGPRSYIRGVKYISVGTGFSAGDGLWLEAISKYYDQELSPRIIIGENVVISHWTHIAATHYVEIGANVLIGSKVIITDHNHGQYAGAIQSRPDERPVCRRLDQGKRTIVGANVWLGDGVVVCPGVEIGDGSVVGANSVVTKSIPPFTLASGVPAVPNKRFDSKLRMWLPITW